MEKLRLEFAYIEICPDSAVQAVNSSSSSFVKICVSIYMYVKYSEIFRFFMKGKIK